MVIDKGNIKEYKILEDEEDYRFVSEDEDEQSSAAIKNIQEQIKVLCCLCTSFHTAPRN